MNAYYVGAVVGGLLMGALCGLGPFIAGKRKGFRTLGIAGFVTCIICGGILGILLAGPVALVWTVIILTKRGNDSGNSGGTPRSKHS